MPVVVPAGRMPVPEASIVGAGVEPPAPEVSTVGSRTGVPASAGTAPPPPPSNAGDRKGPEADPVQPAQAQPAPALGQPPPAEAKKMRRVKALVSGRVQNVGFRAFTTGQANQLGLTGYVFNLKDGRVEAVIEGPDDKVEQLIRAIKTGPPGARVDGVELEEQPHRGEFRSFTISY